MDGVDQTASIDRARSPPKQRWADFGSDGKSHREIRTVAVGRFAPRPADSAVLLEPSGVIPAVLRIVQPADLTRVLHRAALRAIASLHERGESIDHATVAGEMTRIEPQRDGVGEPYSAFLLGCMAGVPTHLH